MFILFLSTYDSDSIPYLNQPIHNVISITISWIVPIIEIPALKIARQKGKEKVLEIRTTAVRLHGKKAELLDTLNQRLEKNKEVFFLLPLTYFVELPYYVIATYLTLDVTMSAISW